MKITYFFRPRIQGVYSIETLFDNIINNLPKEFKPSKYTCTKKLKRFYSYFKSSKYQGDVNHITGDIHTIALFLKKSKTVLTIHDIGRYDRDLKGIKKKIFKLIWLDLPLRNSRYITTISDFTKNRLISECKIKPEKIHVIPNPAYCDFQYSSKIYNNEQPSILQIGSGNNKNIYRLIEAVKDTNFQLILIRKYDSEIEKIMNDLNIKFTWHYNISRQEVYECYKSCDILFFASEYEGFGVPILEANSVGRPVITSNLSSMPFVAGNSGLLVNPYDVFEIRKALFKIHNESKFREEIVSNGLKNLERFSIEKITQQYVELYKEIINKR